MEAIMKQSTFMVSVEKYQQAMNVIKQYREERNMDFYIPINLIPPETVTLEEFRIYLSLRNL